MSHGDEALGMRFHSAIDVVAVKGKHDGGMGGGRSEGSGEEVGIALIDGLPERNSSEGH